MGLIKKSSLSIVAVSLVGFIFFNPLVLESEAQNMISNSQMHLTLVNWPYAQNLQKLI